MVLSELEEIVDIGMPRLNINGKGTLSFATTLVNISGCVIKYFKHRDKTV